jgi:hypothetical protein
LKLVKHNNLSTKDYHNLMMDNISEVANKRLTALRDIEKQERVDKA